MGPEIRPWHFVGPALALIAVFLGCSSSDSDTATGGSGAGAGSSSSDATGSTGSTGATSGVGGASASSGATTGSGTGTSTASGGCVEAWLCTPWDTGGNGDQATRVCTDQNGCGTTVNKPVETATLPALDRNYYECNVEPILDLSCAQLACHGTEQGRALRTYARGRLRITGQQINRCTVTVASESCIGSVVCECAGPHLDVEWQRNYDAARGFGLDAQGNPYPAGQEDSSDLLFQPKFGGAPHAGIHLFAEADADYQTIKSWLGGATLASCNPLPN